MTKVSIIIPVKTVNDYLLECVGECLKLDYPDFEILVFPDHKEKINKNVRVIPSGDVSPAIKRDMAIKHAKGKILAFIDDDAYPRKDWLKKAVRHFKDKDVGAVGGPGITPESDNRKQKASGLVFSSVLTSGSAKNRYVQSKEVGETDDWPTVNLLVRKNVFDELGGFDNDYWPGEDTKFSLDLIDAGYKIIQDPEVLVYHHRREVFKLHLKQVKGYALHRGFFMKKFPKTSLRPMYMIPSLFVIFLFLGFPISTSSFLFKAIYTGIVSFYLLIVFLVSINRDIRLSFLTFVGIVLTHITYGVYLIFGLFSRRMRR